MLKRLVEDMVNDRKLPLLFARDPNQVFEEYGISKAHRKLLLSRNEAKLSSLLGRPLLDRLLRHSPEFSTTRYPNIAELEISSITPKAPKAALVMLSITFNWLHIGVPTKGLPGWLQVHIFRAGKEIAEDSASQVPTILDLVAQRGLIIREFAFPKAGKYKIVLGAGHPEIRASKPFPLTVLAK